MRLLRLFTAFHLHYPMSMLALGAAAVLGPTAAARAQDCFAPVRSDDVEAVLTRADVSWSAEDPAGFDAAVQELDAFVLPCLVEPVTPPVAAHIHRVHGLAAFVARQRELALSAIRASKRLEPAYVYTDALLPPGHELRVAHEAASGLAGEEPGDRLPAPKAASLWFDGAETRVRPADRPTVAQVVSDKGDVRTAWLPPEAPMLPYPRSPRLRTALAISSGVAAGVFGGLLGGSAATRAQYFSTDPSDTARLDSLRSSTNGLAGGGIAAGVSAVGLAVAAIAVGPR